MTTSTPTIAPRTQADIEHLVDQIIVALKLGTLTDRFIRSCALTPSDAETIHTRLQDFVCANGWCPSRIPTEVESVLVARMSAGRRRACA